MKKYICVILALVFSLSILTSCGEKDTSGKSFAMAVNSLPSTFDPQIAETPTEKIIALNCFDTLLRPNENGELEPLALETYSVSKDGLVYELKIRKGLKYFVSKKAQSFIEEKNGTIPQEITAKDFAFGIVRGILPETKAADYILLSSIKNADAVHNEGADKSSLGIKVLDDYTLQITLERADADFLYALSQPITAPCNEQFFGLTAGRYGLEQKYSLFSGAFYVSYTGNETSVSIAKNAEYTGLNDAVPASVTFYVNEDFSSVATKIKKGNYDCGFVDSASESALGSNVTKTPLTNITYSLVFNLSKSKLDSLKMRQGLVYAIDYSTLPVDGADGIVAPNYYLASKKISNTGVESVVFDVQSSRTKLKEAFQELEISNVDIQIICTKETEEIAKKIISSWQKNVGVELNGSISLLSSEEFYSAIRNKEFDMAIYPITVENKNAVDFMACFETENENNFLGYSSEEYDRIFETLCMEPTNEHLVYAQSFLMQNAIVTPLYFDSQYLALAEGVTGIYFVADTSNVYFFNGRKP